MPITCDGVWVLFKGSELHSLWPSLKSVIDFVVENNLEDDPEYYYEWVRIEE